MYRKGSRRKAAEGRCPFCLGEENVKHVLLDCLGIRNWRRKFIIIITTIAIIIIIIVVVIF